MRYTQISNHFPKLMSRWVIKSGGIWIHLFGKWK